MFNDQRFMKNIKTSLIIFCGVFLFLLDRMFKWQAIHAWVKPKLIGGWFGWQPFFNPGVAFGIPIPPAIIVIISILIILVIVWILFTSDRLSVISDQKVMNGDQLSVINDHRSLITDHRSLILKQTGLGLILTGAISNFLDRLVYGFTVDYLRIYTSMINLADVMIVIGFVMYLLAYNRKVDKVA